MTNMSDRNHSFSREQHGNGNGNGNGNENASDDAVVRFITAKTHGDSINVRPSRSEPNEFKVSYDAYDAEVTEPFRIKCRITVSEAQSRTIERLIREDARSEDERRGSTRRGRGDIDGNGAMVERNVASNASQISFDNREDSLDGCDLEDPITGDVLTPDRVIRLRVNSILRCYDVVTLKMVIHAAERNIVYFDYKSNSTHKSTPISNSSRTPSSLSEWKCTTKSGRVCRTSSHAK